jgi:hypothetical protein
MSQKVSRRILLHVGLIAGIASRVAGARDQPVPRPAVRGKALPDDAYAEALRLHGGELGGSKTRR